MHTLLKWSGILSSLIGLVLAVYLVAIQLTGNFATVLAGELYRSNQPTPAQITGYVANYGIKTIVNLRGSKPKAAWYQEEVATARALGLTHIDVDMAANREFSLDEARQLATLLRDAPKPLLIHCRSGSDRTGLASAIYLNQVANVDEETAEWQLSLRFGHIGIPFVSPAYAMDESWERLERSFAPVPEAS
jgi:protein tyrosine/serine phosphatase